MRFDSNTIVSVCAGRLCTAPASIVATRMTWDSREAGPGCLFVALPGERVDGHDFIGSALDAGAAGAITCRQPDDDLIARANGCGSFIVVVDDCQQALSALASAWRDQLEGTVVALTGSSGKTTTKNLVRDVLAAHMTAIATKANQNNELGVPATLLEADADTACVVVEMGMRGTGQIAELCAIARPDMALVTNVGTSHIELLGSQQGIAAAKAEIYQGLATDGVAFVLASDEHACDLVRFGQLAERGVHTVFYDGSGADPEAFPADMRPSVYASDISFDGEGFPTFTFTCPAGSATCTLGLAGAHNVINALAAVAVGCEMGVPVDTMARALADARPASGRQDVRHAAAGFTVVDDSYNANPDSMAASLAAFALKDVAGRRIAVLGDMAELGSYSREGHRDTGARAAQAGVDLLVCVGERSRDMLEAAREADPGLDIEWVPDAQAAVQALEGRVRPGDCVLVKASHSTGLDVVAERLVG